MNFQPSDLSQVFSIPECSQLTNSHHKSILTISSMSWPVLSSSTQKSTNIEFAGDNHVWFFSSRSSWIKQNNSSVISAQAPKRKATSSLQQWTNRLLASCQGSTQNPHVEAPIDSQDEQATASSLDLQLWDT